MFVYVTDKRFERLEYHNSSELHGPAQCNDSNSTRQKLTPAGFT